MSQTPIQGLASMVTMFTLVHALTGAMHPPPTAAPCLTVCGSIPVKYPFGTGFGCGHPIFADYVKCSAGTLQLTTYTGIYPITSIDYTSDTLVVLDPLMSTCDTMQNSGSFGLESTAPFAIMPGNIFALLGCSTTSPVYDSNVNLCDTESSHVCRGMYSCKGVTGIGLEPNAPISTCCVYQPPIGLDPGYEVSLPKLQCSSYTCVYGFGVDVGDPTRWKYGVSLRFNGSDHTDACKGCEESGGVCGYAGIDDSFTCVCRNGVNSTANCYGQGFVWSGSWRQSGDNMMGIQGFLLFWLWFFISKML